MPMECILLHSPGKADRLKMKILSHPDEHISATSCLNPFGPLASTPRLKTPSIWSFNRDLKAINGRCRDHVIKLPCPTHFHLDDNTKPIILQATARSNSKRVPLKLRNRGDVNKDYACRAIAQTRAVSEIELKNPQDSV